MAVQPIVWDALALLEQNRQRLMKELQTALHAYEARYELPSDRLEDELAAGRIRETAEVCEWLIDWHTYQALLHDVPRSE